MAGTPFRPIARYAQEFERDRHRIGGKLAAAGAGSGTGMIFQIFQFSIGHLAGRMFAHSFEDVLDRDVMSLKLVPA